MDNYFNYFTEIEEHYLRRRGTHLLLSTLDWALIETWKSAGVPLEAVLRGVDDAFDKYDLRPSKSKKVNSLAYCSQAVLAAAEDMKEAAVGAGGEEKAQREPGFEAAQIAAFLREMLRGWKKLGYRSVRDSLAERWLGKKLDLCGRWLRRIEEGLGSFLGWKIWSGVYGDGGRNYLRCSWRLLRMANW